MRRFIFRRKIKVSYFNKRWQELQKHCGSRKTWPQAIGEADKLLDIALRQRELSFNEAVWFSHKYYKKISEDDTDVRKLKKKDVAMALAGFRQALRDLGVLDKKHD
jgi:hypothetical protein